MSIDFKVYTPEKGPAHVSAGVHFIHRCETRARQIDSDRAKWSTFTVLDFRSGPAEVTLYGGEGNALAHTLRDLADECEAAHRENVLGRVAAEHGDGAAEWAAELKWETYEEAMEALNDADEAARINAEERKAQELREAA